MSERKLRIGIVGAHWGIVGHLPVWRTMDDVEVVAICTAHPESAQRAGREQQIPLAFADHRQMLREADLDIVDTGTKPSIRQHIVLDALEAGKHVLTCNPFAVDAATAEAQYARQQGRVVGAIEAQLQWLPQFRHIKALIDEGYIGRFQGVNLRCHFGLKAQGDATFPALTRPTGYPSSAGYNWLGEAGSGGSVVRNIGGQCLHPLVALFGEIEEVVAHNDISLPEWHFPDGTRFNPETPDLSFSILRFRNGGTAELNLGWSVPHARGFAIEIWGTEGRLRATAPSGLPDTPTLSLSGARLDRSGMPEPARPLWRDREAPITVPDELLRPPRSAAAVADNGRYRLAMFTLFRAMIEAIRTGGEATPGFRQALHVQHVCEAIERSGRTRRWEAVPVIN